MKHGDKKKAAASKTVKKASGSKETSKQKTTKSGKAVEAGRKIAIPAKGKADDSKKAAKAGTAKNTAKGTAKGAAKGSDRAEARESRVVEARTAAVRVEPAIPAGFANPALSASYKRAAKKYENAFRRLND